MINCVYVTVVIYDSNIVRQRSGQVEVYNMNHVYDPGAEYGRVEVCK